MQLKTVGESLTALKSFDIITNNLKNSTIIYEQSLVGLKEVSRGYSVEALKAAIAQSKLDEIQIRTILSSKGLTGQLLETTTAELTQATSTNALAASQTGATASTLGLGTAIKGLGASMKAFALSNLILTAIAAIGVTIYGAVKAFDALTVSFDEAAEKTKSSKDELDKLTSEISNLNQELETTKNRIEELLEKANSGSISLLEEEELNTLREQNDELQREIDLKEKLAEIDAREAAENAAYSITYRTDDNHWDDEYNAADRIDKLQNYVDSANFYQEKISEVNQQILAIEEAATDNSYKQDSAYKDLIKEQERYQEELQKTEELMSSTYKELSTEDDGLYYNGMVINGYDDLVDRLDTVYMAVELYLNGGNIEDTTSDYIEAIRNKLIESGLSEEISNAVAEGFSEEELNSVMSSGSIDWSQCLGLSNATAVIENIKEQLASVEVASENDVLSISDTISQLNTRLRPTFDSLKSAYNDIFTDDGFNLNAVDIPMLDSIRSSIEEINELEDADITIDMGAFDSLATTLTDVSTTEEQARQAFNDFATSIFYATDATDGMTDETRELVEQLLESLGIANATEVAEYALAEAKAKDVIATHDVVNAARDEYAALLAEGEAAGTARQQLYSLTAAEIAFGQNDLNTEQKIAQLRNLASAYGDTASAALATAIANDLASGHTDVDSAVNDLMARINAGVKKTEIDFSGMERSAAKAGSSAGKSYADALKDELSNLNSVISYIGDTIGDQIDLFEDQKDAAVEALEAEQKAAEEALEAEKELVQEKIDAKQAEIDAIEEASKARKNEIDLQKAQYDLERMQNQKTSLIYTEDKGMIYETDTKEIRETRNAVTEAKENIQIAGMEKEISGLNDTIDDLDKKIEESNEYYDRLIEETEKYWNSLIKGLEDYKSRWQEFADIEEQAKMEAALRNLGITTEDVLNMSESAFESFRGTYLGLLNEMYSGNDDMISMLQKFGGISTDTLRPLSGTIDTVADSLDKFAGSTGSVNTNTSAASESVGNLNTNTAGLSENLSGVSDTLDKITEDNRLETTATQISGIAESVRSLSDALSEMPDGIDLSDTVAQFDALGNSVDKVTASISGGNASKAESGEPSGKNAPGAQGNSGNGADSLVGSIREVKSETDRSVGTGEDSGAIGQFSQLGQSVMDVTDAIGGSGNRNDSDKDSGTLISSIETLGETTTETLGEPDGEGAIGKFGEFGDTIAEAENHTQGIIDKMNELDGMTAECTITVNVETNGSIPAFAEGTLNTDFESGEFTAQYGKAFAEGTGKYQGLPKAEKNALVSEYGQTEMTVLPNNGGTIITNEPTLMDLPKDTVIYNEEQTKKIMDNKVDVSGTAHAEGTSGSGKSSVSDNMYIPYDPDLDTSGFWEICKKWDAYMESIDYNVDKLTTNAMYEQSRQMQEITNQINNNTSIINNRNQPITFGDIHVTCPGVTEQQVARYVPGAVKEELRKEFSGFSNLADQWSRR